MRERSCLGTSVSWNTLTYEVQQAALEQLTDRQRDVFQDRLNGHSWRRIADAYGIHEATARGHWKAAVDRLKPHINEIRKAAA